MIDGTALRAGEIVAIHVEIAVGRLYREDRHLHHILTHSVPLAERPKTAKDRRGHAIARVLYTWLCREQENPEAMAKDIESLATLGRSERWERAIKAWANVARTDPEMFHQYGTYTNFAVE